MNTKPQIINLKTIFAMKKKITVFLSTLILLAISVKSQGQALNINMTGVKIEFSFPSENTTGTIGGFEASITFDSAKPEEAVIGGNVKVNTINTGVPKRDEHLKSDEYFNAVKYPKMKFKSTKVEKTLKGFKMTGMLTIMAVEKEITINFSYTDLTFKATSTIYVKDFGIMGKKDREATKTVITMTIPITA